MIFAVGADLRVRPLMAHTQVSPYKTNKNKKSHPVESGWLAPDITLSPYIESIPGAVNCFLRMRKRNMAHGDLAPY
jgi:hypothetical protein